jgi:hypothetical protein
MSYHRRMVSSALQYYSVRQGVSAFNHQSMGSEGKLHTFLFLMLHVIQAILSLKMQSCPCAHHECTKGSRGILPLIINLGIREGWVVSFMPGQLCSQRQNSRCWVGPRAGGLIWIRHIPLTPARNQTMISVIQHIVRSLYWLCYHDSLFHPQRKESLLSTAF